MSVSTDSSPVQTNPNTISDVKRLIRLAYATKRALFIHGKPGCGKCLDEDSLVLDATTGELVPIKDFDSSHDVVSFVNGELTKVRPESKTSQGIQKVYELQTRTGRRIRATSNHPFLCLDSRQLYHFATNFLWKELRSVIVGDRIAIANNCPIFGNYVLEERLVKFVAYMIAEGHYESRSVNFTNSDPEILDEFRALCNELGFLFHTYVKENSLILHITSGGRNRPPRVNPGYQLLKQLHVKIANSGEKELPSWVFQLNEKLLALFLNRLFSGDGWAETYVSHTDKDGTKHKAFRIFYTSKSGKLIHQVQHLLTRFGVTTYLHPRLVKGQTYYTLSSNDAVSTLNFFNKVGFFGKFKRKAESVLPLLQSYAESKNYYRGGIYRYNLLFDEVKSVREIGDRRTFDLVVPIAHNFVAEDIVVHNSSVVRQIAEELKIDLRDVRLNQLEPVDLRGLPMIDQPSRTTVWTIPDFLPREGKGILFFDEFNTVDRSIQSPTLQLILDRRLGNYSLPEGWIVVAAGNNIEDKAQVYEMSSALNNRFFHVEFPIPTYEEWFEWGSKDGRIHSAILSFLNLKPSLLFKFDPKQKDPAWASPRSWELASDLLKADNGRRPEIVRYAVGEGASLEFEGWWRLREKIPDPDQLFKKPRETNIPNEISLQLVVATLVVEKVVSLLAKKRSESEPDKKLLEALDVACILASRLPPEVQTICIKMLVSSNAVIPGTLFKCPNWKPLGSRLAKYVMP